MSLSDMFGSVLDIETNGFGGRDWFDKSIDTDIEDFYSLILFSI